MWWSTKCPHQWLTESEPRDAVCTSFIENLGGAHMCGSRAGADPIARWKSNGCPGGCHLHYVMQRVEQCSAGNQVRTGLTTVTRQPVGGGDWEAVGTHEPQHIFLKRIVAGLLESAN